MLKYSERHAVGKVEETPQSSSRKRIGESQHSFFKKKDEQSVLNQTQHLRKTVYAFSHEWIRCQKIP